MIGFFAVVLLVCTIQMLQKKSYDAYILYAGPKAFTAEQENARIDKRADDCRRRYADVAVKLGEQLVNESCAQAACRAF